MGSLKTELSWVAAALVLIAGQAQSQAITDHPAEAASPSQNTIESIPADGEENVAASPAPTTMCDLIPINPKYSSKGTLGMADYADPKLVREAIRENAFPQIPEGQPIPQALRGKYKIGMCWTPGQF